MKTVQIISTAALLLALAFLAGGRWAPAPALAAAATPTVAPTAESPAQPPRTIRVNGDAEVKVIPDEVTLTLGVETWDRQMSVARSANDVIVKRVLALCTAQGIDPKYVQTDYINVEPRYRYESERTEFIGYFVRKNIVITLRDLDKFEEFYAAALDAGVTHVHNIDFHTTELRKYRDQARQLALEAARQKAEAMAGTLGQSLGAPLAIQEVQNNWWGWYGSWWGYGRGASAMQNVVQNSAQPAASPAEGTLSPGQISVTASVTVEFVLK